MFVKEALDPLHVGVMDYVSVVKVMHEDILKVRFLSMTKPVINQVVNMLYMSLVWRNWICEIRMIFKEHSQVP